MMIHLTGMILEMAYTRLGDRWVREYFVMDRYDPKKKWDRPMWHVFETIQRYHHGLHDDFWQLMDHDIYSSHFPIMAKYGLLRMTIYILNGHPSWWRLATHIWLEMIRVNPAPWEKGHSEKHIAVERAMDQVNKINKVV